LITLSRLNGSTTPLRFNDDELHLLDRVNRRSNRRWALPPPTDAATVVVSFAIEHLGSR
jgi:hypothetical protein